MSTLEVAGISVVRDGSVVLEDVSAAFKGGELCGIIGPNGAGKSSLLRVLAGISEPDSGTVSFNGQSLNTMTSRRRAQHFGYLAQNPLVHWPLAVRDVVALGTIPWLGDTSNAEDAVENALTRTNLHGLLLRPCNTLSGGELARVHLARLWAGTHQILCLDEPTANLDPRYQTEILELLRQHADGSNCCVLVLHDLALAARYCDRLVLLDAGRVAALGQPQHVLDENRLREIYGVRRDYNRVSGIEASLAARS